MEENFQRNKRENTRKLSLRSISWIMGAIAAAVLCLGFVIPTQWCMDGCSTGPNYFMVVTGVGLFIDAVIVGSVEGSRYLATQLTKGAKRGLGWISGLSLFIAIMFSVNGWYSVMIMMGLTMAMPFIIIGGIIALIVRAVSRREKKTKMAGAEAPTIAEKKQTTTE
jgi:hypothetical protein